MASSASVTPPCSVMGAWYSPVNEEGREEGRGMGKEKGGKDEEVGGRGERRRMKKKEEEGRRREST